MAFTFGLGHVGIAIGSSIAALVSVIILEAILYKDGFLKMNGIFNKFNLMILLSSAALVAFLYIYTSWINFMELNQIKRVFFLLIEVTISIAIYFSISRLVFNRPLKQMFD